MVLSSLAHSCHPNIGVASADTANKGMSKRKQCSFIPLMEFKKEPSTYLSTLRAYSLIDVSLTGNAFSTALMSIDFALAYPSISPVKDFCI